MTDMPQSPLQQACNAFADQTGQISILVEGISHTGSAVVAANTQMPAASVLKLAIACAAYEDESIDLGQFVELREMDQTRYCSILQAFETSATFSLRDLIGLMIIISDNPATTSVLDVVTPARVDRWLKANGLNQSTFTAGFTDHALKGGNRANLTTASDCLKLLQRIYDARGPFAEIQNFMANN